MNKWDGVEKAKCFKCVSVLQKFPNQSLGTQWKLMRTKSAFIFIKFWRMKFLSYFTCSLGQKFQSTFCWFLWFNVALEMLHVRAQFVEKFIGSRECSGNFVTDDFVVAVFSLFPRRLPAKMHRRLGRFRRFDPTVEAKEERKSARKEAFFTPCQKFVWTPVHFTTRFLKHHKGVALNGENIWRLPKPGYHIGAAHWNHFLIWMLWWCTDSR